MCGLAAFLAPAVSLAAVAYRTTGAACQPRNHEQSAFRYAPALSVWGNEPWPTEGWASVACPLPTSDSTFTPTTLSHVNVRYYSEAVASVAARLYFHDYDALGYVECGEDVDNVSTNGFRTLELEKSCLPIEYESNWGMMIVVEAADMTENEYLNVKLLSAYD